MNTISSPLQALREEFCDFAAPVVVYNKSHSGSRLLAALIAASGIFMGARRNDSLDSLDILDLVRHLVLNHYPDYSSLWEACDAKAALTADLVRDVISRHLEGFDARSGGLWGWKLCETAYILPVVDFLFPRAKYIHIIRDGRDAAFCDHHAPDNPFWKKIYFNTDRIESWQGRALTWKNYRKAPHIFNALHWANSVMVGHAYGMMMRERCLEVRYEELCLIFETTARKVQDFIGIEDGGEVIRRLKPQVHADSIHKYANQPRRKQRAVMEIIEPLLLSLGYLEENQAPGAFDTRRPFSTV